MTVKIEVLGSGCSKCRATVAMVERAALEAGVDIELTKVEDRA